MFLYRIPGQKGLAWDLATAGYSSRMRDRLFLRSFDLLSPICLLGDILAGTEVPGRGVGGGWYLTTHCHHQNDFCIKMDKVWKAFPRPQQLPNAQHCHHQNGFWVKMNKDNRQSHRTVFIKLLFFKVKESQSGESNRRHPLSSLPPDQTGSLNVRPYMYLCMTRRGDRIIITRSNHAHFPTFTDHLLQPMVSCWNLAMHDSCRLWSKRFVKLLMITHDTFAEFFMLLKVWKGLPETTSDNWRWHFAGCFPWS